MATVQMIRRPDFEMFNPALQDVRSLMTRVAIDEGVPLVMLKATSVDGTAAIANELWICRLDECNRGKLAGWLVRYKTSASERSSVLAARAPVRDVFEPYELFGVFENVRAECLVPGGCCR
jgi:hypothetical protein